jgi:uroporphyrinogen decarboxylase
MGLPYTFRNTGGISMAQAIDTEKKIASLSTCEIAYKLKYVTRAIRQTRSELGSHRALLGFSGSPWTLASYMVEGGSSKNFAKIKQMLYSRPNLFDSLLSKITGAVIDYVYALIEAGVDAVQIFDSWAGVLSEYNYWDASAKYIARIIQEFKGKIPVILYPKGAHSWIELLKKTNAEVIGLDWTVSIARFYDDLGCRYAVQGNLDPALLNTEPAIVRKEALRIINEFGQRGGHIFNLGHGIYPDAKVGCMAALADTVVTYSG